MALGTLTLASNTGQIGRAFSTQILGQTAGSVLTAEFATDRGAYVANGILFEPDSSLGVRTVRVRETLASTGETQLVSFDISFPAVASLSPVSLATATGATNTSGSTTVTGAAAGAALSIVSNPGSVFSLVDNVLSWRSTPNANTRGLVIRQALAGASPAALDTLIPFVFTGGGGVPADWRVSSQGLNPLSEQTITAYKSMRSRVIHYPRGAFRQFRIRYGVFGVRPLAATGSIASNVLTVTALTTGSLQAGMLLTAGVGNGATVLSPLTQAVGYGPGSLGTYQLTAIADAASGAITGPASDWFWQASAAVAQYRAAFEDVVYNGLTGITGIRDVTFNGGQSVFAYNYTTWDYEQESFVTDWIDRGRTSADPIAIWTAITNPGGLGIPVGRPAAGYTARNEGMDFSTSVDFVAQGSAGASSISPIADVGQSNATYIIAPIAIETDNVAVETIAFLSDSRGSNTGEGGAGSLTFGDAQGDTLGNFGAYSRGIHNVAQKKPLNLSKPSDRSTYFAASPNSWKMRRKLLAKADVVVNAYGQNDQTNLSIGNWAATTPYSRAGMALVTSNRVYTVRTPGTSAGTAPTSTTTGVDITDGTAVLRYMGTSTDSNQRSALGMIGIMQIVNDAIKAAVPSARLYQNPLDPYTDRAPKSITSLTSSGTTAVATLADVSGFVAGMSVTVSGATPSGYNGTFPITAVDGTAKTISYTVASGLTSPAAGTIILYDNGASETGQITGFGAAVAREYNTYIRATPTVTGAFGLHDLNPGVAGSSTVNGAADDLTRFWIVNGSGNVSYFATADGIHRNSRGAYLASLNCTASSFGLAA